MELTKAAKNDLWRAISAGGLDPRTCVLEADDSEGADLQVVNRPGLRLILTPYRKTFGRRRGYLADWLRKDMPARQHDCGTQWSAVLEEVESWARAAQRLNQAEIDAAAAEADLPDLWELGFDPEAASLVAAVNGSNDNRAFTAAEQAEIASQIRAIKELLSRNSELTAEQLSRIDARLDEVEEASHRLGRKDWIMLFGGGVFALILADAIPPDVAYGIFTGVMHGLTHLFISGHFPGALNP